MLDILEVPAFRSADALHFALRQALAECPQPEDPVVLELRQAGIDVLAQTIYAVLGIVRGAAVEEVRRAVRRIQVLVDVAVSRRLLGDIAAHEVLTRAAGVWHEVRVAQRPRPKPAVRAVPIAVDDGDTQPDALPPPPAPTRLLQVRKKY